MPPHGLLFRPIGGRSAEKRNQEVCNVPRWLQVSEFWRGQDEYIAKFIYTAKYDGQEYPISHEGGGTITFTRHDANVAEGVSKTEKNETYTFKQTVSQDGKTLIIETLRTDSSGKERKDVLVYDKMK
jgi:hypothetical protein